MPGFKECLQILLLICVEFQRINSIPPEIFMKSLRERCPNTEFFLVRIFSHLDLIRRDIPYLRIQSEWRKIRARKNSVFGHFSRNEYIVFRWLQMMGPYKVIYSPKFAYYIILEAKFNNPFMLLIELLRRCFALLS